MDYEKKYNEALERAKKVKHDVENIGCVMSPDMLEVIFPELAESEDERIREELIEQVGYLIPDKEEYDDEGRVLPTYHKRIEKYRAWLEKQRKED